MHCPAPGLNCLLHGSAPGSDDLMYNLSVHNCMACLYPKHFLPHFDADIRYLPVHSCTYGQMYSAPLSFVLDLDSHSVPYHPYDNHLSIILYSNPVLSIPAIQTFSPYNFYIQFYFVYQSFTHRPAPYTPVSVSF